VNNKNNNNDDDSLPCVPTLDLFDGPLPPGAFELRDLDLHANGLQEVIPHKLMAGLKNLECLRLHMNGMFSAIHKEITHMKSLKELYLFGNYIAGTIPKELASLKKLGKHQIIALLSSST
jgi:hypothetical protein